MIAWIADLIGQLDETTSERKLEDAITATPLYARLRIWQRVIRDADGPLRSPVASLSAQVAAAALDAFAQNLALGDDAPDESFGYYLSYAADHGSWPMVRARVADVLFGGRCDSRRPRGPDGGNRHGSIRSEGDRR